jgi:catechol 2,3-dioxygenase-like lactoylglutathione lyase family enzyme
MLTSLGSMSITNVQLLSVPVSDQDRARDFYVETLGFVLVSDTQLGPDMRWVMVSPPNGQTALTLVTWFPTMPAGSLKGLVLQTDDLSGDLASLTEKGVDIPGGIERAPWGDFVQFNDPDGNGIVLQATAVA